MFIKLPNIRLKKGPKKVLKSLAVFLLVTSWLLTGYPGFWLSPVKAATTTVFITSTSQATWTVPNDWTNTNTIEVIGGGGGGAKGSNGGAGGGGGGAYAKITNLSLTPGGSVDISVGAGGLSDTAAGGGDSWFNGSTCAGSSVCADGGLGTTGSGAGTGGTTGNSVGTTLYAGGNGGTGSGTGDTSGGGGGAGGPGGSGKNGGNGIASSTGGAGGGGGSGGGSSSIGTGGTSTQGGAGGNGYGGSGGGTAGVNTNGGAGTQPGAGGGGGDSSYYGGAGAAGQEWDATHGSGGGGGGGANNSTTGGAGALYGGGGGGNDAVNGGLGGQGIIVITYTIDTTAPTPNPMTFSSSPNNDAAGQISMTASQATDENVAQSAISYLFTNDNTTCTSGHDGTGGTTGSWQLNDRNYTDTGLDVNKCYGYKIQAKDTAGNTTTASSIVTTYSSAAVPGTPTLGTPTSSTLALTNAENGNPATNPTTYFAVQVVTTTPTDSTWLNQWVNATGNPSATAVWLTDAQLDALVLQGLQPSTLYGVKVKARNQDNDETSLSAEGQGTTSSTATATFTQNNFEFYVTANSATLTDPWPSGTLNLGEKAVLTQLPVQNMTLSPGGKIRIKINFSVATANLSAGTQAFQLEYSAAEDCTTAGSWTAVGAKASGTIWRLYDEASIGDSTTAVNNLSDSTVGAEGYYSEINPSANNPNAINSGQISEWDWPLEDNGAAENTTYCFRMAKSGGTALDSYSAGSYPKITTSPGTSVLMRHGNFFQNSGKKGFFWVN